jgi:NAD(P)-dependent dehydrogenase (short-subunit alcohol dehydrogenase family)
MIVTGSTRGIGRALALAAADEGACVVVHGTREEGVTAVAEEIERRGGSAVGHACSLGTLASANELVARCVDAFGRLDGLVNNAGITQHQPEPWRYTEAEVREPFEVNTFGSIFCGVAALRELVASGSGSIVNVLSGAMVGVAERSIYSASKGAVASWTYSAALDLEGTNVRINGISPTAQTGLTVPKDHPVPQPETVAPLVLYLLSSLSEGVNGQVLRINGSKISAMNAPRFGKPLEAASWTPETIADAVRNELAAELGPVGIKARNPDYW